MPVEVNLLQEVFLLLVHVLFTHIELHHKMWSVAAQNRAGPKPCGPDPTDTKVGSRHPWRVYCKRKDVPREFRFLFSKLVWEEKGLVDEEVKILFDLYLKFEDLANKDANYAVWVKPLKEAKPIMRKVRVNVSKNQGLRNEFLRVDRSVTGLILDSHGYFGMKGQERLGTAKLVQNPPRKRRLPPKRFIGVGYKDKGNLRDKSYDGTPSWEEVVVDERMRNSAERHRTDWLASADSPQGISYGANWSPGTRTRPESCILVSGHSKTYVI
jgi:hypothetical protein